MGIVDPKEQQRLADVEDRKRRGKGTPKKAKTKGTRVGVSSSVLTKPLFVPQPTAEGRRRSGRLRWHASNIIQCIEKLELLHSTTKKLISRKQARLRSTTVHTIHTQVSNTEGILTTFFYPFIPLAYTVSPQFIKSPTKSCQMDDCMFPSGDPDARRWPGIGFTSRIGALEAYPSFMPVVL